MKNNRIILAMVAGSRLYGTHSEDSDYDYIEIIVPPIEKVLFSAQHEKQYKMNNKETRSVALSAYCAAAARGESAYLLPLFTNGKAIMSITKYGKELLALRQAFVSKRLYFRFRGHIFSIYTALKNAKTVDVKQMKTAMRLLLSGSELLSSGKATIPLNLSSVEFINSLYEYSLSDAIGALELALDAFSINYNTSQIPEHPDEEKIYQFVASVYKEVWNE